MDFLNSPYCRLSKRILFTIGLWPYQNLCLRYVIQFFLTIVLIVGDAQLTLTYITADMIATKILATLCSVQSITLHFIVYVNIGKIRALFIKIKQDWESQMNSDELEIMHKYAELAKRMNFLYAVYCFTSHLTSFCWDNRIISKFRSKRHSHANNSSYIRDESQFNFALIPQYSAVMITLTELVANEIVFFICIYHTCARFEVLSYRLERVLRNDKTLQKKSSAPNEETTDCKIVTCINTHIDVTEFAASIESYFSNYFAIGLVADVVNISMLLVAIVNSKQRSLQSITVMTYLFRELFHLFLKNYMGNKITEKSSNMLIAVYDGYWYEHSLKIQKSVMFMQKRCRKPCFITAGKLYTLSLNGFCKIMDTIMSFFMLMRQFQ